MKLFLHVCAYVLILYSTLVLYLTLFQRRFIYYPEKSPKNLLIQRAGTLGLKPWYYSGNLIGWHKPAENPPSARVLICGGNAGSAINRFHLTTILEKASDQKLDTYILEYPGYGSRPGQPNEKTLTSAALEAAILIREISPPLPLILVGESLGTGVVCSVAQKLTPPPSGLLLITPFDNLVSAAKIHYPFLPVGFLLQDKYKSDEAIKNFRGRIAILLASEDTITPPHLGRKLASATQAPTFVVEIPNTGHNDILQNTPPEIMDKIIEFLFQ
ncbi:MAG: hypothetical protein N2035_04515 [Chthoniobacterales bacterium]|nr:hypothetical protein [Chthoniobacterales bacterium]MCX7712912.1 hypothetical protein [Chthoniobacterales bacterium]